MRQEGVLLGLVEPVYLIHEEEGGDPLHPLTPPGLLHHFPDFLHSGEDR